MTEGGATVSQMRRHVQGVMVARLATVRQGRPHLVPITFALEGDDLYFAVDRKPKTGADLQRLRNIAANPAVSVLIDSYEDDCSRIWWVRLDGTAEILPRGVEAGRALALLAERYPQYRADPPPGPVVAVRVARWAGWSGAGVPGQDGGG